MFAHVPFLMRWYRNYIMARVGIFITDLAITTSDVFIVQADLIFLFFRKDNKWLLSLVRKVNYSYTGLSEHIDRWL